MSISRKLSASTLAEYHPNWRSCRFSVHPIAIAARDLPYKFTPVKSVHTGLCVRSLNSTLRHAAVRQPNVSCFASVTSGVVKYKVINTLINTAPYRKHTCKAFKCGNKRSGSFTCHQTRATPAFIPSRIGWYSVRLPTRDGQVELTKSSHTRSFVIKDTYRKNKANRGTSC